MTSSPSSPPSTSVSIAPSNSGRAYRTTCCSPITPFRFQSFSLWSRSGAATQYGTSSSARIDAAISVRLPAAIEPAGPPTRGNPIVLTTASTRTLPRAANPVPASRATVCFASRDLEVKQSLTTVWASTPLMNMGNGRSPFFSSDMMSSSMYFRRETTCFRYNNTPTLGALVTRRDLGTPLLSLPYQCRYSLRDSKYLPGALG
mmetsp:Transcript_3947/g.12275  ORF Transcript_3947/g.12275 Transcript_3947/m.12275 type:complete len:203 (+) Transcript_3947:4089-4697(+)